VRYGAVKEEEKKEEGEEEEEEEEEVVVVVEVKSNKVHPGSVRHLVSTPRCCSVLLGVARCLLILRRRATCPSRTPKSDTICHRNSARMQPA